MFLLSQKYYKFDNIWGLQHQKVKIVQRSTHRGIIEDILGLKTKWLVDEDAEEEEVERNVTERLFSLMRLDSARWEVLRGVDFPCSRCISDPKKQFLLLTGTQAQAFWILQC